MLIGKPSVEFSLAPATAANTTDLPTLPAIPLQVSSAMLGRRSDIVAVERRMTVANTQIGAAKVACFPTFSLGASAGLTADTLSCLATLPSRV